jgi:hypothetical protein
MHDFIVDLPKWISLGLAAFAVLSILLSLYDRFLGD